ncbi:hypothetical protein HYDPIDRAFT_119818, partial [Hydnomerulius pinastri MD-312]
YVVPDPGLISGGCSIIPLLKQLTYDLCPGIPSSPDNSFSFHNKTGTYSHHLSLWLLRMIRSYEHQPEKQVVSGVQQCRPCHGVRFGMEN